MALMHTYYCVAITMYLQNFFIFILASLSLSVITNQPMLYNYNFDYFIIIIPFDVLLFTIILKHDSN